MGCRTNGPSDYREDPLYKYSCYTNLQEKNMLIKYLWLIYTFVFILDFSLELEQEETDSINKLLYTLNHKCEYFHKLDNMFHHTFLELSLLLWIHHIITSGAVEVWFTTTCAVSAYHH